MYEFFLTRTKKTIILSDYIVELIDTVADPESAEGAETKTPRRRGTVVQLVAPVVNGARPHGVLETCNSAIKHISAVNTVNNT